MQKALKLDTIDTSLSVMRLNRPEQIVAMQNSLETEGQLHPIVVQKTASAYLLLDGFKRYYASVSLNLSRIQSSIVDVDSITAKSMILSYNRHNSTLTDYEEAQVVYSLKTEHLLKQEEIATLLSRSSSWVSRRLSFIERLDDCVRSHLQLGKITPTHARELIKLPRGKQENFLKVIISQNLSSRQTALLVQMYLQSKTEQEQNWLLKHPLEAIEQRGKENQINDCRLSIHGNRLLKTSKILAQQQHIFIGQTTNPAIEEIDAIELEILSDIFTDVVRKAKIIHSILNKYDSDER